MRWWGFGNAPYCEMHVSTVNREVRNLYSEGEIKVPQSLALLSLVVMSNAKSRISKSGNVLIAQEQAAPQIENTDELNELSRCISKMRQNRREGASYR